MKTISKSQFKPKALEHMRWVERTGKSLIISDRGRPVLELRPYQEREPDSLRALWGTVIYHDDEPGA